MKDLNFQLILVLLLVAGAAFYLIRRTIKSIQAKNCEGDCHSSPSPKTEIKKPKS